MSKSKPSLNRPSVRKRKLVYAAFRNVAEERMYMSLTSRERVTFALAHAAKVAKAIGTPL